MSLTMIQPGLLTTIQDLGRHGFQREGMVVSGAMDPVALRLANLLVGNPEGEAGLEITLLGPVIFFEQDYLIALTGADLSPQIGGQPVAPWRPVYVRKGSTLQFGKTRAGCRTYLAVGGGFAIPKVMGSWSTYLRAGIGGLHGKSLQANDTIPVRGPGKNTGEIIRNVGMNPSGKTFVPANWAVAPQLYAGHQGNTLRVLPGPEYELFTPASQEAFWRETFRITPQSDRMGCRLQGTGLTRFQKTELISAAVTLGTIQVPPSGHPIILGADHPTTGGYPRIGQVISADFSALAQLTPGTEIRFRTISLPEAQKCYLEREKKINYLKRTLRLKMRKTG